MKTIKEARIQYGLTQTQLSNITGIPFRTIQNWEGGQRKCPDYVTNMVLNLLDQKFNGTKVYLIYRDSQDDYCDFKGCFRGTEEDVEQYCAEHNKKCRYYWQHIEWFCVGDLDDLSI